MFTPDNDKLKNIVFHLLKKKPCNNYTFMWDYGKNRSVSVGYPSNISYDENGVPTKTDDKTNWTMYITIYEKQSYISSFPITLTEKEAMEIKWALDDINDELMQTRLDELADFALEENGTQDELLD